MACCAEQAEGKLNAAFIGRARAGPEPQPAPALDNNLKPPSRSPADGTAGEYVGTDYYAGFEGSLEPGDYFLRAEVGYAQAEQPVTIVAGEVATPHLIVNGTILKLRPRPSEGADVDDDAAVEVRNGGEYVTTDYGDFDFVVPAGELEAIVTIGEATVTRNYTGMAGETIDEDVVLGVGLGRFVSEYVAGMPVEADIFLEIFEAKKALDGSRKSIGYGYGGMQDFELPAGDYVVAYRLDGTAGELPFTIATAELTEVAVLLNAGVLAVTTPGDNYVEVLGAAKAIDGSRKSFTYGYGPAFQTTLPDGDYVVTTRIGDATSEAPVTIKGGERFELTVEQATGKSK